MQNFRDYYQILDIPQTATVDQIKQAYRKLARRYHPDLNPGNKTAEEHFKVLSEAYEVLSDPAKRAQYEEYSRFWKRNGGADGWSWAGRTVSSDADFSEWDDFNHFVDQLLNRHQGNQEITTTRTVQVEDPFQPGKRKTAYTVKARSTRRDAEADLTIPLERAYVGGRERIRLEDGRSLEVNMPAGMVSGQRIRLRGQGVGGGDLYLNIVVEPHPYFSLRGMDILCRLPMTPSEAILGGVITVPTLDGTVQITIPAGVQPGQKLRLAGKGYRVGGERGDQIMEIEVMIPTVLHPEEKVLYQQLQSIESFDPRASLLGGWD
jgi:curved DNA-binding protein